MTEHTLGDILNEALLESRTKPDRPQSHFDYWMTKPLIADIKEYRETHGCGLKEAMNAVRRTQLEMLIIHAESPAEIKAVLHRMLSFIRN